MSKHLFRTSPLEKTLRVNSKRKDKVLGTFSLAEDKYTGKQYLIVSKTFQNERQFKTEVYAARKRAEMSHPGLVPIKDYSAEKTSGLCSTFFNIKLFIERVGNTLAQDINTRSKESDHYSAQQIHSLVTDIAAGAHHRELKLSAHGNIRPELIMASSKGEFSLLDDCSALKNSINNSQKDNISTRSGIHASPELFTFHRENFSRKNRPSVSGLDLGRSDAFSLGIVALEAGNLQNCEDIYPKFGSSLDSDRLGHHFDEFKERYGQDQKLVTLVARLLHPDPNKRAEFEDLAYQRSNLFKGDPIVSPKRNLSTPVKVIIF